MAASSLQKCPMSCVRLRDVYKRQVFEGDTTTGSLMAGQVAGMLHEVRPVADILADLWNSGRQRIAALNTEC